MADNETDPFEGQEEQLIPQDAKPGELRPTVPVPGWRSQSEEQAAIQPGWNYIDPKTPEEAPAPAPASQTFSIHFNEGEFDVDSPVLPVAQIARMLTKRITFDRASIGVLREAQDDGDVMSMNWAVVNGARAALGEKLAALLPPEAMTRDAVENMDIRALLHQVMLDPNEKTPSGVTDVAGKEFTDVERHIAAASIIVQTEKLRNELQGDGADIKTNADGTLTAEAANRLDVIDGILEGYKDGTSRRLPNSEDKGDLYIDDNGIAVSTNEKDILSQDAADMFNANADAEGNIQTPTRFLSQGDIMKMLAGGELDIETLRDIEQGAQFVDPTKNIPGEPGLLDHDARVAYNDVTFGPSTKPQGYQMSSREEDMVKSGQRPWQKQNNDWYSVNEVLSLPHSFTPEERVAIVKRLERAGFLQKGQVVGGDTTSAAFKQAWKTLAASALERNVSMTAFLDERTRSYQETVMDQLATRLTDPARLRASGDYMAKQTLGRVLNDNEQAQMVEFLHGLERQNARIEAGLDATEGATNGVDPLDEGITADIDARMGEWIKDENAVESEAHNTADQYDAFTKMLGGPGRGI